MPQKPEGPLLILETGKEPMVPAAYHCWALDAAHADFNRLVALINEIGPDARLGQKVRVKLAQASKRAVDARRETAASERKRDEQILIGALTYWRTKRTTACPASQSCPCPHRPQECSFRAVAELRATAVGLSRERYRKRLAQILGRVHR